MAGLTQNAYMKTFCLSEDSYFWSLGEQQCYRRINQTFVLFSLCITADVFNRYKSVFGEVTGSTIFHELSDITSRFIFKNEFDCTMIGMPVKTDSCLHIFRREHTCWALKRGILANQFNRAIAQQSLRLRRRWLQSRLMGFWFRLICDVGWVRGFCHMANRLGGSIFSSI